MSRMHVFNGGTLEDKLPPYLLHSCAGPTIYWGSWTAQPRTWFKLPLVTAYLLGVCCFLLLSWQSQGYSWERGEASPGKHHVNNSPLLPAMGIICLVHDWKVSALCYVVQMHPQLMAWVTAQEIKLSFMDNQLRQVKKEMKAEATVNL